LKSFPNRYAVILCGGSGTRLWPLSRAQRPKQLLALNGDKTLLQQTALRLSQHVAPSKLFTVTHEDHKFEVKGQLAELFPEALENVLSEPCAKNTLPAVAWATFTIYQQDPDALIGVFASDHAIDNESAFLKAWESAELAAVQDYLVLLGIQSQEPATGYGYIKPSTTLALDAALPIHQVEQFIEKPDLVNAARFVSDGYLWNSGMFVFRARTFMRLLQQFQPAVYNQIITLTSENLNEIYPDLPSLSMDYGLAEPLAAASGLVAVVQAEMGWSDLGNWNSIFARHSKDAENNVTQGKVISLDTKNSFIWTDDLLVATLGLDNLAIIQTADAILVCDRGRVEDIKALVDKVKLRQPALTDIHQTVSRPWGAYTVLEDKPNFKIKRISVNPGASLSLQMHHHRSEHWVVVSGVATVINDGKEYILQKNQSTYIPQTHRHQLANNGTEILSIIEVQCGAYLGEDDIVRFDDAYGRK